MPPFSDGSAESDFSFGLFLGLGLLEIDDGKLELFDDVLAALRRLPELFSPHLGDSISSAQTFASLRASANISHCARIIAWAAARSVAALQSLLHDKS
jgi:hypothetical protein